jgi:hypothetical protein
MGQVNIPRRAFGSGGVHTYRKGLVSDMSGKDTILAECIADAKKRRICLIAEQNASEELLTGLLCTQGQELCKDHDIDNNTDYLVDFSDGAEWVIIGKVDGSLHRLLSIFRHDPLTVNHILNAAPRLVLRHYCKCGKKLRQDAVTYKLDHILGNILKRRPRVETAAAFRVRMARIDEKKKKK